MYGKIVDASGNTVVADADADMQVSRGGKFIPAPMHYFMRFNGGDGMHAGYLPGYPASHGCVRMPEQYPLRFLMPCRSGLPSLCFGRTPVNRYYSGQPQPVFRAVHVSAHSWSALSASATCNVVAVNRDADNHVCAVRSGGRQDCSASPPLSVGAGAGGLGPV